VFAVDGCTLLSSTERLAQEPEAHTSMRRLMPFVRPHVAALLALIAAALQLVLPILTAIVVDRVLPQHDIELLYAALAAIAAVTLSLTGLLRRYLLSRVAVHLDVEALDHVRGASARFATPTASSCSTAGPWSSRGPTTS
jgi:ABC-type bacteriocin/lantibiotic exporter with double-glycine peptidase domain